MNIAIDLDGTLDRDTELWRMFIGLCQLRGHWVCCVTARRSTKENIDFVEDWLKENGLDITVFFTSLSSKVEYMKNAGIAIHIWIDDDPKKCALGY
jgi:hypothetical protein